MQFLLERLEWAGFAPRENGDQFDLREAVRLQIQRLVSIHVGSGSTGLDLMKLGMPWVTDSRHGIRDDVRRYASAIRDTIVRHEPRLSGVRVTVEPASEAAQLYQVVVQARLLNETETQTFEFDLPRH